MGRRLQEWRSAGQQGWRTEVNKLRRYDATRRPYLEGNTGLDAIHTVERPATNHRGQETTLIEPLFASTEREFVAVRNVQHLRNVLDRERSIAGPLERRKVCGIQKAFCV